MRPTRPPGGKAPPGRTRSGTARRERRCDPHPSQPTCSTLQRQPRTIPRGCARPWRLASTQTFCARPPGRRARPARRASMEGRRRGLPSTSPSTGTTCPSVGAVDATRRRPWSASGSSRRRADHARSARRRARTRASSARWRGGWKRSRRRIVPTAPLAFGQGAVPMTPGTSDASGVGGRASAGSWRPRSVETSTISRGPSGKTECANGAMREGDGASLGSGGVRV